MNNYLGEKIKKLGFGLMRPPFITEGADLEPIKEMIDAYMAKGFSYFDTSYAYGGGVSEKTAGDAIVKRYPRERYQLATKLPMWCVEKPEDMQMCFDESMRRFGVNCIDFYMLHGLSAGVSDRFPGSYLQKADEMGAWDFLRRKKAEGKVKNIGFSYHDSAELLDRLLTEHPDMDFVQLQINYADWEDEVIQSRLCYETVRKHGKSVVIMEPLKGGTLLRLKPEVERIFKDASPNTPIASWAMRFCASLDGVITVLSGMQSIEVVNENIGFMDDFQPLTDGEKEVIEKAVEAMRDTDTIQCTACRYCVDDCPQNIEIPHIFEIVNDYRVFDDVNYAKRRYGNATAKTGKASDCVECGSCESHCPQKLRIADFLKEAAELLE